MAKLVSSTYGDALFELAVEKDTVDTLMEEASAVQQILADNADLRRLFISPKISTEEKKDVIESVFKGRVSDELTGLLCMLLEKSHINEASGVLTYFVDKCREYRHIGRAYVTSAMDLTAEQKAEVEKRLIATTHYETFEIEYKTDPALLGGLVIRVGDKVADGSLRNRLDVLTRELTHLQV